MVLLNLAWGTTEFIGVSYRSMRNSKAAVTLKSLLAPWMVTPENCTPELPAQLAGNSMKKVPLPQKILLLT